MKELSAQECLDKIVTHLRSQGEQSLLQGSCAYRGKDGLMCAVGCLIPDSEYKYAMEGCIVAQLEMFEAWDTNTKILLRELQRVHDFFTPDSWEERFEQIAGRRDLVVPKKG